jgi:hypothetical protein
VYAIELAMNDGEFTPTYLNLTTEKRERIVGQGP